MRKRLTMFVFLVITGLTAACGDSPTDFAGGCGEANPDPNGYCDPGD
jgi:hypothetical protein